MKHEEFDYKELFKYEQKEAIKAMFVRGNIESNLTDFNICVKFYYWLKTLFCLRFNRFGKKGYGIMVCTQ